MTVLAIFGASGNVGLEVTKKALAQGFKVRALLRDPSKMPEELRTQVAIEQGDATKADDVKRTVEGSDAVVVALGTRNDLSPTTAMSDGMKNIISAMKCLQVDMVSVCLSAFLFFEDDKVPAVFRNVNADHKRMFDALKASGLKWIAVLPPHISDNPSSKYTVKEDASPGRQISKEDLGAFLVESLSKPEYYNKVLGIATNT
ncbi:flavin reductase (NADPH) [Bacillus rossius redtenbacheri]|uniref:flavin reductase (NADPH) n=1 Tax=Bacillus rossius redtenbacheri TaxID=93214 RepID=UPI002FDEDA52